MKVRIIKRTLVDKRITFVIQQKHFILKWLWVDAWTNNPSGAACVDSFGSLDEAVSNLCYFDGSSCHDEVVHKGGESGI